MKALIGAARLGEPIGITNFHDHVAWQRARAAEFAAAHQARGGVILTALTPEQRQADKLDELLTWPARYR